jgi:hypothetical protein
VHPGYGKEVACRPRHPIHPADREEPKDFIERLVDEILFRRFVWSLWLAHLLERRGLRDICLSYAEDEHRWYFEMRLGRCELKHRHALKWAMQVDVCKLHHKIGEDSFESLVRGDAIWGTFIADHPSLHSECKSQDGGFQAG